MTPLVSIVIPCYNHESLVGNSIESALSQTYSPTEVIVVDDGSEDGSKEVVRSFGSRVTLVSKPHSGLAATRNAGFEAASGTLIQSLDSDDLIDPNKLETQVPAAIKSGEDVVTIARARVISRDDTEPSYEFFCSENASDFRRACGDIIQTAMPLFWKSQLTRAEGLRTELPCTADLDLMIRLAVLGYRFLPLPQTLATIRKQHGSMTSKPVRISQATLNIVRNTTGLLKEQNLYSDENRAILAQLAMETAINLIRHGKSSAARPFLAEVRHLLPSGNQDVLSPFSRRLLDWFGPSAYAAILGSYHRIRRALPRYEEG